ncbi:MAG: UDP-glucose 4-epimerase GalE [Acidobacteria bacterium]|nr:UDP-glucose 4-epimerase GalE [Acidobacteriota bacterium]
MRTLVVGGAGYIGSHVVLALLDAGPFHVAVLDDFSTGHRINVPDMAELFEGDFRDRTFLHQVFRAFRPQAVIHLAALKAAGESMNIPVTYANHNLIGSLGLIHTCLEYGIEAFVFSSTAAVYGDPVYLPLDEDHPTKPINFYGYTKLAIEEHLSWYSQLSGLSYASLRYFNAAGYDASGRVQGLETDPRNLIPIVMETAAGLRPSLSVFGDDYPTPDGTCVRDYIHVTDLADAHVRALEAVAKHGSLICNLGTGSGFSVLEVLASARKVTSRPIPSVISARRPGDPPQLWASNDRATRLLGWKPQHSDLGTLLNTAWQVIRPQILEEQT